MDLFNTISLSVSLVALILIIFIYRKAIKQEKIGKEILKKQAITDELTGIYNRRHIDELLEQELNRAKRYHRPMQVMFLDINNLKTANDTHGHDLGDQMLRETAKILRGYDICGRYGGDEFIVILPETEEFSAYAIADRIRTDVERIVKEIAPDVNAGISVGVSSYPDDDPNISAEELLKKADAAMYKQKRAQKASA